MYCTSSGLNIVPVLVSNSVASSFMKENGRPKRRKGEYFPFSLSGTNGEMDLSSSFLEMIVVAGCSQNFIIRNVDYLPSYRGKILRC